MLGIAEKTPENPDNKKRIIVEKGVDGYVIRSHSPNGGMTKQKISRSKEDLLKYLESEID